MVAPRGKWWSHSPTLCSSSTTVNLDTTYFTRVESANRQQLHSGMVVPKIAADSIGRAANANELPTVILKK